MFLSKVALAAVTTAALLAVLTFCGCSETDEPAEIVAPPGPVQSATPTILMENFAASYTAMDLSIFEDILHDDFKLVFLEDTIIDWELEENAFLDRDQMHLVHENMFGGIAGLESNGYPVRPLVSIDVDLLYLQEDWAIPTFEDADFPGMHKALYDWRVLFLDNSGTHAFNVTQQLYLYAEEVGDSWYLAGIKGIPLPGKGVENASYDSVLYLYHATPEESTN